MDKKYRIYIASPYTFGWQSTNVRRQLDAADILLNLGYAPYTPLLTHFQSIIHPRPEHEWIDLDLEYLKICVLLVRIKVYDDKGNEIPSNGADKEEAKAKELKIPVLYFASVAAMEKYFMENKPKIEKLIQDYIGTSLQKNIVEIF